MHAWYYQARHAQVGHQWSQSDQGCIANLRITAVEFHIFLRKTGAHAWVPEDASLEETSMNRQFLCVLMLLIALCSVLTVPHAQAKDCATGCGNPPAPGHGTGKSACWVTFVAPEGMRGLKGQLYGENGYGLLRNVRGQIAIRGGSDDTTRVSVDCRVYRVAAKAVFCAIDARGYKRIRTLLRLDLEKLLPPEHQKGGFDVQL